MDLLRGRRDCFRSAIVVVDGDSLGTKLGQAGDSPYILMPEDRSDAKVVSTWSIALETK